MPPRASIEQPHVKRPFTFLGSIRGAALDRAINEAADVAPYRTIPVLLIGERGVGKEVMARSIHRSYRPSAPFCALDCGACVPSLAASELFGYEKGAFTGAHTQHIGLLEQTKSGILFMDEIARLPYDVQPMLLRVLQEKAFRRVGGTALVSFDGRIVSATNGDLCQLVNEGHFLPDLFDRIAGATILLPKLAEQKDVLCNGFRYFVSRFLQDEQISIDISIDDDVDPYLLSLLWPGNFRDLQKTAKLATAKAMRLDGVIRLRLVEEIVCADATNSPRIRSVYNVPVNVVRSVVTASPSLAAAASNLRMPQSTLRDICVKNSIPYNRAPQGRRKR